MAIANTVREMRIAGLVVLLLATGCYSISSLKTARALPQGTGRLDVVAGWRGTLPKSGLTSSQEGDEPRSAENGGDAEIQARLGIFPRFDVGVKTNLSSIEASCTVELVRSEGWGLAVAPAAQAARSTDFGDAGWDLAIFKLPVLVGLRFAANEITLGPTVMLTRGGEGSFRADAVLGGATVGLSIRIGPWVRFITEVAVFTPLAGDRAAIDFGMIRVAPDAGFGRPVMLGAMFGMSFGPDP